MKRISLVIYLHLMSIATTTVTYQEQSTEIPGCSEQESYQEHNRGKKATQKIAAPSFYDQQATEALDSFLDAVAAATRAHYGDYCCPSCKPKEMCMTNTSTACLTFTQEKLIETADVLASIQQNITRLFDACTKSFSLVLKKCGSQQVADSSKFVNILDRVNNLQGLVTSSLLYSAYYASGLYFVQATLRTIAYNIPRGHTICTQTIRCIIQQSVCNLKTSVLEGLKYLIVPIGEIGRQGFTILGAIFNSQKIARIWLQFIFLINDVVVAIANFAPSSCSPLAKLLPQQQ